MLSQGASLFIHFLKQYWYDKEYWLWVKEHEKFHLRKLPILTHISFCPLPFLNISLQQCPVCSV